MSSSSEVVRVTRRDKGGGGGSSFTREDTRYEVELAVRLRCGSWSDYLELYTSNLSRGGLFVGSSVSAPVGSEIAMELTLPDGEVIALRAEVVHVTDEAHGQKPGMGIMFFDLDEPTRQAIDRAVQTAKAQQPKPPVAAAPPPPPAEATRAPVFGGAIEQALNDELVRRRELAPRQQLGVGPEAGDAEIDEAYRHLHGRYQPSIFARYGAATRAVVKAINELIDAAHKQLKTGELPAVLIAVPEAESLTPEELEQRRRGDEARQALRAGIERRVEEACAHRDMGRLDDAIRSFESILNLDRKNEFAREELRKLRELKARRKR